MSRRYRLPSGDRWTGQDSIILCNMGFRKNIAGFESGPFDVRLNYNEENDMLERLKKRNDRFMFSADLAVYHYRREKLSE